MIIRTNSDHHHCLTCKSKVATGGNDDITNSIKHIVSNHPPEEITLFLLKVDNLFKIVLDPEASFEQLYEDGDDHDFFGWRE